MKAIGIAIAVAFAAASTWVIGALAYEGSGSALVALLCAAAYGLMVVTALVLELRDER